MSVRRTLPSRLRGRHERGPQACGRRGRERRGGRERQRRCLPTRLRRLALLFAAGALGSAVLGALGLGAAAIAGARLWTRRVVVEGRSMAPSLEPGDRLLVVRLARRWPVRPGDVVALSDPRTPDRLLVKRVSAVGAGRVTVLGDNPAESTDSRSFGPVARAEVWGRACYRYAPFARAGRVAREPSLVPSAVASRAVP